MPFSRSEACLQAFQGFVAGGAHLSKARTEASGAVLRCEQATSAIPPMVSLFVGYFRGGISFNVSAATVRPMASAASFEKR